MTNTQYSEHSFDTGFDLEMSELPCAGALLNEHLVLYVNRDCCTSEWLVCCVAPYEGQTGPMKITRTFVLPKKQVAIDDTIYLWTKRGRDRSEPSDGSTNHHFHMNLKAPIWNRGDRPFIFKLALGHGGVPVPEYGLMDKFAVFGGTGVAGAAVHG